MKKSLYEKSASHLTWLLSLVGYCLFLGIASAQTNLFWDQNGSTAGTGGTGNWSTSNAWRSVSDTGTLQNWDNAGTSTANLGGTAGTLTIDTSLSSGVTMAALNVNTSGYTITSASGNRPLNVASAVTLANNVGLTFNMASTGPSWGLGTISFGTGSTLTVQGNGNTTGSNRVNLTTSSTITGGSIVLAGTGVGPTGFAASSTPAISVTLNTNILNNSATSATMLGANNSNTLSYGGVVSGSARMQISAGATTGAGTVILTNNNTYTGDTFLNHSASGVLRLGIADALPTSTALFLAQSAGGGSVDTGGTMDLAGFNQTLAGVDGAGRGIVNTGAAATLTLGGSGSYTLTSQIGIPTSTTNLTGANNNITVIKNGSGTQTLSGAKGFTGGLYINSGTLRVTGSVAALGGLPGVATPMVFLRGGTLVADATSASLDSDSLRSFEVGPISGSGSATIQVDGANSFILRGNIADTTGGSGRIIKTGTGILRLQSNAKTFTGGITIQQGTLSVGIDDRLGAVPVTASPGNLIIDGGTLLITGSFTLNANRGVAIGPTTGSGSGRISVDTGVELVYDGLIANNGSGIGTLVKTGPGTLRLQTSANTFSGGLQVLEGDVSVGNETRLGAAPGTPTPGHLLLNGGGLTITSDVTLNANRGIALGPNTGTGTGTINVTTTNTLIYEGIIANNPGGTGRLVKTGTGTLRLQNSSNTFSAGLTVEGGLVSFALEDRIGAVPGSATPGSIILNGGGLRLTNNNLTVNANRGIALGADGGTGTGVLSIATGLTMTYNGIIANNGSGSGALDKLDTGTLRLGGANTYTGGTTLTGGTLLINNTTGSGTGTGAVNTLSGTTLGGTGTLSPGSGNSISIAGSLAPGTPTTNSGVGTLTFTPASGDATFMSPATSTLDFQLLTQGLHGYSATYNLDGTLSTLTGSYVGGGNDRLIFNGGSSANKLDFTNLGTANFNVTFGSGYTPAANDLFDLLDWTNLTGIGNGNLNNEASAIAGLTLAQLDLPTLSGGLLWDTSFWTSHGVIGIVVVPEPSRVLMLALGLSALIMRRSRW
ncbi:MAG: autotransporter-associated beta strand repeat-containing protein [Verrucomicrobia bacterium]|nr:autotransporter-associated beta strand repeat-containing protein [Verrucomicrobiota bacterium]